MQLAHSFRVKNRLRFCLCCGFAISFGLIIFQRIKNTNISSVSTNNISVGRWKEQKIFCFVLTSSPMHNERVLPLIKTWLPRCDRYELHTDKSLPFPSVVLHNFSDIKDTWSKLRLSIAYLYENALEFDWFVRSCDNTYFIVDNLRMFLRDKDPDKQHYYGEILPHKTVGEYNSGAGFVLSRATLKLLAKRLLPSHELCPEKHTSEDDVEIARCLAHAGVLPEKTRDEFGKERFHQSHFDDIYRFQRLATSLSLSTISLHRLSPNEMYFADLLLYGIGKHINHNETNYQ